MFIYIFLTFIHWWKTDCIVSALYLGFDRERFKRRVLICIVSADLS